MLPLKGSQYLEIHKLFQISKKQGEKAMKKTLTILCLTMGIFLITAPCVQAHMVWISADNPSPETGESVYLKLGFGHDYPSNQVVHKGQLDNIYALDSKGGKSTPKKIFPGFYKFTPKTKGIYLLQAELKSGFVSATPDGHKLGSKKDHKDAKSCFRHHMNTATVIQTQGSPNQNIQNSNKDLRLLPLDNPSEIKVGNKISFRVLFNGERIENVKVLGTFKGSEKAWVQESTSNQEGIVRFKIDQDNPWLFQAKYTTPYKDKSICDKHTYKTTITITP